MNNQEINLQLLKFFKAAIMAEPHEDFGALWMKLFYPNDGESAIFDYTSTQYHKDIVERFGTSEKLYQEMIKRRK